MNSLLFCTIGKGKILTAQLPGNNSAPHHRKDDRFQSLPRLQVWRRYSFCPHRKSFAVHHFLLHSRCPDLWARSQFKEDRYRLWAYIWWRSYPHTDLMIKMKAVHRFIDLGFTIMSRVNIYNNRLARARSSLDRHLIKRTRISVHICIILATLLGQSGGWHCHHLQLLKQFLLCSLYIILNIHQSDFVTNIEVLEKVRFTRFEAMILKLQLP